MSIGSINPVTDQVPKFSQIYVHDPKEKGETAQIRYTHMNLPRNILDSHKNHFRQLLSFLEENLKACNPYIQKFIAAE